MTPRGAVDQRIADDVRTFTTTTLSLTLIFLNGALTIIAFSGVLWSISPLLFGVAVLYASTGSLVVDRSGSVTVPMRCTVPLGNRELTPMYAPPRRRPA